METVTQKDRDIVINPNEFAYIQDRTAGTINVAVGPIKKSLGDTENLVSFDQKTKRFTADSAGSKKQTFSTAPEGWYIILKNPAQGGAHPALAKVNVVPEGHLQVGKKVNLPGPIHVPLWPGQMAKVVRGHHLRSNQYLLLRVYDEGAARQNISKQVAKPAGEVVLTGTEQNTNLTDDQKSDHVGRLEKQQETKTNAPVETTPTALFDVKSLITGSLHILKGTDVSFYMPPTGIEVVPEIESGHENYVRDAVTLERLEYCILLSESGEKRYVKGPDVVFPTPTEIFKKKDGMNKFKAYELTPTSGIYVKVIDAYKEDGKDYHVGEELFLTGEKSQIYFPREEHAIIRYGKSDLHHAIALPAGEGRYVLNRRTGAVAIVKGPKMFLPDPRTEVVVRRILENWECELYYPNNEAALEHNEILRQELENTKSNARGIGKGLMAAPVGVASAGGDFYASSMPGVFDRLLEAAVDSDFGDEVQRKTRYTPPRTLTLNNKFEGPVIVNIWTGYAVQVVSKSGERKVIRGPVSHMLEYDQTLEKLSFSKGMPKRSMDRIDSVYLRVKNNHVADIVNVETRDLIPINVKVSMHTNFEGDESKWFEVENYVKLLVDRVRSLLRNQAKKVSVQEYMANGIDMIRSVVLDKVNAHFDENNMVITDVEVLAVEIARPEIQQLLVKHQLIGVEKAIEVKIAESLSESNKLIMEYERADLREREVTDIQKHELTVHSVNRAGLAALEKLKSDVRLQLQRMEADINLQKENLEMARQIIERKQMEDAQILETEQRRQNLVLTMLESETAAAVKRLEAIQPGTIEALITTGQSELLAKALPSMAPLSIVERMSVGSLIERFVKDTGLDGILSKLKTPPKEQSREQLPKG